ncbi:MAG: DNA replication/repair protein RecF [Pseudomonadales bacterium]
MPANSLILENFRCFSSLSVNFSPTLNLFHGANAAGKTSLLEALYFLGHGRSFRSAKTDTLIRGSAESFMIRSELGSDVGTTHQIGLGKKRRQGLIARMDGKKPSVLSDIASVFPIMLIDSEANRLIQDGPGRRRRYLDWGVFHVEHKFLPAWRRYQRALKQRNELLRQSAGVAEIRAWDSELIETAEQIDTCRRACLEQLQEPAQTLLAIALPGIEFSLHYRPGWAVGETYDEALEKGLARDRSIGATQAGPHRADLDITLNGVPARERVSRGQQKMLAGALWLAQSRLFRVATGKAVCLLVDDLPAELDSRFSGIFQSLLLEEPAQLIMTATSAEVLQAPDFQGKALFHVEQGAVTREA